MSYNCFREVRMRPAGSPRELEQRRYRALQLLGEGHTPVTVARLLGVDRRSVRRWKAAARQKGSRALAARPASGRPARLGPRQKRRLERALLRGAQALGFPSALWTCPRVAELIHRSFGVRYHVDHVSRLLHGLGWSPQKPQRRAVERDEEGIRQWVKQAWPRLKKKPDA
jgi:transposase